MDIMEIILLAAGGIIFILSFFIPEKKTATSGAVPEDGVQTLVRQELELARGHVEDVVEEAVTCSMEKTERSLERLSNEKIMAVSEYSDTVLGEIHKSHEEAMFLYDMLNDKHKSLKNTIAEVNRAVKEAQEAAGELRRLGAEPAALADKSAENMSVSAEAEETRAVLEAARRELPVEKRESGPPEAERQKGGANKNENILRLYRQGKSVIAIARELDLGVGEVKLVIDLFRNQ